VKEKEVLDREKDEYLRLFKKREGIDIVILKWMAKRWWRIIRRG